MRLTSYFLLYKWQEFLLIQSVGLTLIFFSDIFDFITGSYQPFYSEYKLVPNIIIILIPNVINYIMNLIKQQKITIVSPGIIEINTMLLRRTINLRDRDKSLVVKGVFFYFIDNKDTNSPQIKLYANGNLKAVITEALVGTEDPNAYTVVRDAIN